MSSAFEKWIEAMLMVYPHSARTAAQYEEFHVPAERGTDVAMEWGLLAGTFTHDGAPVDPRPIGFVCGQCRFLFLGAPEVTPEDPRIVCGHCRARGTR